MTRQTARTRGTSSRLRRVAALLALSAAGSAITALGVSASPAAAATTVVASADAYVQADVPSSNFGSATTLSTRASGGDKPAQLAFVKFTVPSLPASATVRLQLFTYSTTSTGADVYTAANSWTESGVTWSNAPATSAKVATMAPLSSNTWATVDLSSVITASGTYTLALKTTSTLSKQFASREVSASAPRLVIDSTATSTATSSPSTTATPSSSPTGTTTSVALASADAYVRSDQASTNYGTAYVLGAEAASSTTPHIVSYLRFAVSGLSGTVVSATLQVYSYATSTQGITASTAPTSWTETGITYANRPAVGTALGNAGMTLNTWTNVDVTPAVTGNGTIGLALTTTRTTNNQMASREASATPPKLVIVTSGSSTTTTTTTAPATTGSSGGATIVAAGDISCPPSKSPTSTTCQQQATSDIAVALRPDAVLPLGDEQYEKGSLSDFASQYGPSWGRMNSISHPIPGNHEYGYIGSSIEPTGGTGYFTYFGDRSHPQDSGCTTNCTSWYSYDVGSWHLIALDSQCAVVGGCNPGNPQYNWLKADLAAHPNQCTLAYWHIPLYSSSSDHQPDMTSMYQLLYDKNADVILTGHAHFYERFGPQDAAGNADGARGIPQFIVGTGGRSFFSIRPTPSANSVARIPNTFGVLKMTLSNGAYSWNFVPANAGGSTDSGTATCH